MKDQDTRGVQVESVPQCPRGTTRTWCPLLGHLCPSSDLANSEGLPDPVHPSRMAKLPTRFCHGIPTSACRNAALRAVAAGLQAQRDDKEDTCSQVDMHCIWPEASWPCLEQIHGPGHARNRLYSK